MKIKDHTLGFLGFGHMAKTLFRAFDLSRQIPRSQVLFHQKDPQKMGKNQKEFGISSTTLETLLQKSDLILICVRPHQAEELLRELSFLKLEGRMFASIMAGVSLSFLKKYLGPKTELLRVMPNLASEVSEGMSLFSYAPGATDDFKSLAKHLFSAAGRVLEIEEKFMDIGCGLAGSLPGFVFRLIESAARLGETEGLSYEKALQIAAQSFLGAARLILDGRDPLKLIHEIATPNGTTEAGFRSMKETHIELHLQAAILAAASRSKEISK